ncbi:MAG: chemotaxis protein CheB [Candidatus Thiodiazotropha sp.]
MPRSKRKPATVGSAKKNLSAQSSIEKILESETIVPVVGVAASAGGLKAFRSLLSHLPVKSGFGFVLIQHLDPNHKSILAELLAKDCPLPVKQITDGMVVEHDHVYIIPPNELLTILHNQLIFLPKEENIRRYNPADIFFQALADDRGAQAIGVILSGTASDGTLGCRAIKEAGGITFAQDHESAEYSGMPENAQASGCVDFVLGPEKIAKELFWLAHHKSIRTWSFKDESEETLSVTPEELNKVFILLRSRTGNDFSYYKDTTLKRRINRRMLVHKLDEISQYIKYLQKNPQEIDALFQDILINVTAFFRDPEAFESLNNIAFPQLLDKRPMDAPIRVWVPGCSTGQEAYSIALALHEYLGGRANMYHIQIFGSDIDERAIENARSGIFPESIENEISQERLKRYFIKVSSGYQVNKLLRDMCVFAVQNIAKDPPFSRIDLLSCRNLLIYLGSTLQKKVLQMFHYALQPNGLLLLGSSETIGSQVDLFAVKDKKSKLYQKKSVASRLSDDLITRVNHGIIRTELPERVADDVEIYDLGKEAERLLLDTYAPPGIVVTPDLNVVRFLGRTWPYIEPTDGAASLNLYKIAHPDLVIELRAAIHKVNKEGGNVRKEKVLLRIDGEEQRVDIQVLSLGGVVDGEHNLLVMFEPCVTPLNEEKINGEMEVGDPGFADALALRNAELEREVLSTREYMQSIVEEQEGTNEELRSANQEIQSTNEELQSINEELETAKEELQSTNEELATVNEELENRNEELSRINDDLSNLMVNVNLPILMLDRELRIRQFTRPAESLLNLIDADVDRPIGNIKPNIEINNLEADVLQVIDSMTTKTQEVQDDQGHWYSVIMRPYKTLDNRIDGAVVTFLNIDSIKDVERFRKSLEKERYLAAVVRDSNDAITVQDLAGNIKAWNPAAERIYGFTEEEALALNIREIVHEKDRPQLERLQLAVRERKNVEPIQLERMAKDGSMLQIWLVASALVNAQGEPVAITTTERLISD